MAKRNRPTHILSDPTGVYSGELKENPDGSKEFVGKKFNPVKMEMEDNRSAEFVQKYTRKLLESFAEYYYSNNRSVQPLGLHIDSFLEKFNPVKIETEELQPEQPKIKANAAFENSRLEFLRMQIGPVQNFYQTLGNILFSLSMRLDVAEAKIESLKGYNDQLNLERALYKRYAEYCKENKLQWSEPGFVEFIREYANEEEDETTANAK